MPVMTEADRALRRLNGGKFVWLRRGRSLATLRRKNRRASLAALLALTGFLREPPGS